MAASCAGVTRVAVMIVAGLLFGFSILALANQLLAVALAAWRVRPAASRSGPRHGTPPVTIVRPVRGLDHAAERTLGSAFRLDYPEYEILFASPTPTTRSCR